MLCHHITDNLAKNQFIFSSLLQKWLICSNCLAKRMKHGKNNSLTDIKWFFLLILCLHQSVKHLETVMIWDCISGGDVVYLVKIDEIMNTEKILMWKYVNGVKDIKVGGGGKALQDGSCPPLPTCRSAPGFDFLSLYVHCWGVLLFF